MNIEIKINFDPAHETLVDAMSALLGKVGEPLPAGTVLEVVEEPKPTEKPVEKHIEKPIEKPVEAKAADEDVAPWEESKAAKKPIEKPVETKAAQVTKTDIRAIATAVSKAGKKAELKAALEAFGAAKLSEVNEADYPALKARLEALNA